MNEIGRDDESETFSRFPSILDDSPTLQSARPVVEKQSVARLPTGVSTMYRYARDDRLSPKLIVTGFLSIARWVRPTPVLVLKLGTSNEDC
jgi:hypothetical protein